MSNVTIVRISGGPESLFSAVGATRDPSPGPESTDASTVTFANGRVTLKVDASRSPGLPRRPQRTRRRTQLVHHRDRHLRQEVKVVSYLPSPKAPPAPRRSSTTSDAATSTSVSDVEADAEASPAPSSAASSFSEPSERSSSGSGVGGVNTSAPPPPTGLRYRLSLAEQYQNQLFTEPDYVISAPAAFAGDWAANSDAHDSGLEGSESDAAPRSDAGRAAKAKAAARALTRASDVTDTSDATDRTSDVTDGRGSERGAASDGAESHVEPPSASCARELPADGDESELCGASAADESGYCCASGGAEAEEQESGEFYTTTSEESGYCYIPAKEQRECSQEVLFVVSERVSPADFTSSEGEEDEEEDTVPEDPSRKISEATTVDKHFYFGEEVDPVGSESESSDVPQTASVPAQGVEEASPLTVHNLRRLEELQSRSALPESFLAFKQALLESGDMSGLRKADLYTVLGGTVRGYPASWDDLGSKFDETDNRSDEPPPPPAPDASDARSGVSIDAWTVDRRGRYRAAAGRGGACSRRAAADALAALGAGGGSDGWYPLCVRCDDMVYPQDGVRPAPDAVYHVACLRCAGCERPLSGEEVHTAGRLVFCGLHAPPEATVCTPGSRHVSRPTSCASSTDGRQVSARTAP